MPARLHRHSLIPLVAVVCLHPAVAAAGPVRIAPVRVDLDEATRTAVVELTNPSDTPLSMQAEVMAWSQDADGEDQYEPTADVLAFPPIFTIAPGESQLVRVGMTAPQTPGREAAYRLYFTELPSPDVVDNAFGLTMRLRVGLPVFSSPIVPRRHELRIVSSSYDDGVLTVRLRNTGNTHVRVSDVFPTEAIDSDRPGSANYILAGGVAEYSMDLPADMAVSTIQVVTNELGQTEYDLDSGLAVVAPEAELASR